MKSSVVKLLILLTLIVSQAEGRCCCKQRKQVLYDKNRQRIMMRNYLPYRVAYYRFQKKCYEKRRCSAQQ